MGKGSRSISTQEGELCPIKLCDAPQALGNYTPKKPYLWPGVMFLSNSKTQNQQFGVLWLQNRVSGHWPSQGAKLWPFKGAKTGVFGFSRGVTYLEYLSWHVANTISSLTAILLINRCPPPVLGHHPFLVVYILEMKNLSIQTFHFPKQHDLKIN